MKKNKTKILQKHDRSKLKQKRLYYTLYKAPSHYNADNNKCGLRICDSVNLNQYITNDEYLILNYNCGCRDYDDDGDEKSVISFINTSKYNINMNDVFYSIDKQTKSKYR